MTRPPARRVILVGEDARYLNLLATELRALGLPVFCAHDFEHAAQLVRAGLARRFVLVRLADDVLSPAELRAEMATHLPGWAVTADDLADDGSLEGVLNQLVN
jgi:ActR/RegA family two-component response regulator